MKHVLPKNLNVIDTFNKKHYYKITKEDEDTYSFGYFEEHEEIDIDKALLGIGQIALNNGCDVFLFRKNFYLAESHNGDDFLSKQYEEECNYCYNIHKLSALKD